MSLFSSKPQSYLGVDIGAEGVKIVELRKNKGRPQLWTYGLAREDMDIHPFPNPPNLSREHTPESKTDLMPGSIAPKLEAEEAKQMDSAQIDRYAHILKTVVKQSRATATYATASLPVSYIFHTVLNLPQVDPGDVARIVQAEVKKFLPRPIEEMQIASQVIPQTAEEKKQKYMRVLVTAVPKFLVSFYSQVFARAGLKLQELETEAFALERSLVGKDTSTVMIVDVGAERTNFFIIDQGMPMTHRTLQLGGKTFEKIMADNLGMDLASVSQMKKDLARLPKNTLQTPLFADAIDAIVKEIEYNFDVFLHQVGNDTKRPEKIILTGGASAIPSIQEGIEAAFAMKVFIGDPWARVVYQQPVKPLLDEIGPRMSVAIGLAMRNILG